MLPRFIHTIILYPGALCSQGSSSPSYFILGLYALKVHPHHHTLSWGSMLSRFLSHITLYLILVLYAPKVHPHHHTLSWGFMLSRFLHTTILNPGALCSQGSFSQLYLILILGLYALKVSPHNHTLSWILYVSKTTMYSFSWKLCLFQSL